MGKQTAKRPVFTLAQLIDRRQEVERQIESLNILKGQLAEQIIAEMKTLPEPKAFGGNGIGYQLISSLQCDYEQGALDTVEKAKVTHLFTAEPKITRSKVLNALKKDKITQTLFDAIQAFAGPVYTKYTLKTLEEKAKT